jgi:hypothetical protein
MRQAEYKEMVDRLRIRLVEINTERAELDVRRSDLDREAAGIKDTLVDLLPLSGEVANPGDLSGLGFTNAIRGVLGLKAGEWMSAPDVKEMLGERGFELSTYTNPMASIYKILSRLKESEEIEVKAEGIKMFYRVKPRPSLLDRVVALESKKNGMTAPKNQEGK